jgi:hypothetical protein
MSEETIDPPPLPMVLSRAADPTDPTTGWLELVPAEQYGRAVMVKSASGPLRERLRREAELLRELPGSALVELIDTHESESTTSLVLGWAGASTMADTSQLPTAVLLRAVQLTAEAVAGLHRAGWSHGRLAGEHVIVSPRGGVRLCSLSAARPTGADPSGRLGDCAALGTIVEAAAEELSTRGRAERRYSHALRRELHGRGTADRTHGPADPRRVIAAVDELRNKRIGTWGACFPRRPRRRRAAALAIALMLLLVGAVASSALDRPWKASAAPGQTAPTAEANGSPARPPRNASAAGAGRHGPGATAVAPIVALDGARYRVGLPGDVALSGDWDCDGRVTIALLRPATGELFEFPPDPAPTGTTSAALRYTIFGGLTLGRGRDAQGRPTCDRLLVRTPLGWKEPK